MLLLVALLLLALLAAQEPDQQQLATGDAFFPAGEGRRRRKISVVAVAAVGIKECVNASGNLLFRLCLDLYVICCDVCS